MKNKGLYLALGAVGAVLLVMAFVPSAHAVALVSGINPDNLTLPLGGLMVAGYLGKTVSADLSGNVVRDTIRAEHNKVVADLYYHLLNRIISSTVALQPVCARATTASKVKTTNATVVTNSGVVNALAASDDFWTLTGTTFAAGLFRRYLLLVNAADVASVVASSDAATAAGCVFPSLPADGLCIVGIVTIQNATNPFIPGTTLLSAAGVTDTYIDGIDATTLMSGIVTP